MTSEPRCTFDGPMYGICVEHRTDFKPCFAHLQANLDAARRKALLEAQTKNALDHYELAIRELAIREMKLKEKAEQRVRELEAGLASKIGPDWREALPYESEFELAGIIEKLKQQIQDVTTGRDKGWARVRELEGREPYLLCTIDHTPPAGWHSWNDRVLDLEHRLAEAQAALRRIVDVFTSDSYDNSEESQRRLHNHVYSIAKAALAPPPPETRGM